MPDEPNPNDDSDRRDFLRGGAAAKKMRAAIRNARDLLAVDPASLNGPDSDERREGDDAPASPGDPPNSLIPRSATHFETYSGRAMACEFEILFNMHQYSRSGSAAMEAFEMLEDYESLLSIYRETSELSRVNREAFDAEIRIEPRLYEMLSLAMELNDETGGAFDITSGPLSRLWGFDRRSPVVPDAEAVTQTLAGVGSDKITLDSDRQTIRFSHPQLSLNPGGIGKGFTLDKIARHFVGDGIGDFIIHGGQSSVIARGSSEIGDADAGWTVGVSHPTTPGVRLGSVRLINSSLGTSGSARQGFFHRGRRYGHIIDPRTGWPADHILSSTVVTPSAAVADALATAFFVMPVEKVRLFCEQHTDVAAILVVPENETGQVRTIRFNLPDTIWIDP